MEPYYKHAGVTIYHGDCRKILPRLQTARACITDPPYGATSLEWDRWVSGWLAVGMLPTDTLWCFGSMTMFLDHRDEFVNGSWKLAQDIIWEKHNGSAPVNDRFRRVHENVVHWYRGAWAAQLQQTPTTPDATARTVRRKRRPPHWGQIEAGAFESHDGGPRLARSVQRFRSEHGQAEHPTPKPVGLIRMLIEYSTKPGDLVIDPFCGGGPVLVAAKQLGRQVIGIDTQERWCEVSAKRCLQEMDLT